MYTYNYQIKGDSEGKAETILRAKFRFRRKVAPEDRETIKKRIKFDVGSPLVSYFKEHGIKRADFYYPTKFGFNLKIEAKGKVPLEEILDLDELKTFILTGKTPNTVEEKEDIYDEEVFDEELE